MSTGESSSSSSTSDSHGNGNGNGNGNGCSRNGNTNTNTASHMKFPPALQPKHVTMLGYGALMSEQSSRLTFPNLTNFRYVKVKHMRRVFGHPHTFLVLREKLIDVNQTLNLASLSVEPVESVKEKDVEFVAIAFDVILNDQQRMDFVEREKEYKIVTTPYYSLSSSDQEEDKEEGQGVICIASNDNDLDESIISTIPESIKERGGIWHWKHDSGLKPADIYLRHCLLSLQKVGGIAYESFLNDTYLADRRTNIATYLEVHGERVMSSLPPKHLSKRFGG
eukprot:CAMPEP_0203634908 /NCGR_PEP_ID=MMETSP0088-20131115/1768_1 /ASSEMBLY_ACC=CAM_ASM_001087 /TAXON_ID=426623 /ORGANISM="Chaetoceros affinis, Strain CCMP159" /LENGTH=279 /DNA_ID=CAMNT_0050488615 /DNA_START=334 /DNA_END=1173 /DNA_ORIENTATION=+